MVSQLRYFTKSVIYKDQLFLSSKQNLVIFSEVTPLYPGSPRHTVGLEMTLPSCFLSHPLKNTPSNQIQAKPSTTTETT